MRFLEYLFLYSLIFTVGPISGKFYLAKMGERDVCDEPKGVPGPCEAEGIRWTFDKISRKCEMFSYGGCKGNGNNFHTKAECEKKCDALSDQGGSCTDDNGVTYKHGDMMPAGDGCNSCQCFNGQKTICTERGCNIIPLTGASCIVNGKTYKHGEGMPSKDGCNSCVCINGEWRCPEADCFDLTDKQEGDSCGFDGGSDPINYGECAEGLTCVNDRPQSIYPGVCREKDCVCNKNLRPVCGDNGKTYANECSAECLGTKVKCDGKCPCSSEPEPEPVGNARNLRMNEKDACDNGIRGIEKDLKNMKRDSTCHRQEKTAWLKRGAETNLKVCENVPVNPNYKPKRYIVAHYCMNETIDLETVEWGAPNSKPKGYRGNTVIPTHAPHRPVWANFGEYAYLPPERYQHNIEHGCVVMLYHPCLDKKQVHKIKKTVSNCLRKHIITPSRIPTPEKPVILVAWGCYQELEYLDHEKVRKFIHQHGLQAPEGHFPKNGKYTHLQIKKAKGQENKILCRKPSTDQKG